MITWHLPSSLNFFYRPKDDLYHLFLSRVGRKVSIILLQLFSPIYIFQIAKSINFSETKAILVVLGYYLFMAIVRFLIIPLSENLSQKIGFKGIIWASAIPFFIFIPSLVFAKDFPYLLILSAFLFGVHSAFYWWGYHGYFVKSAETKHIGRSVGQARLFETLASVITPVAGAVIASYFGFTALFITAAIAVYLSLLLLGRYHDKKQKRDVKYIDVLRLIKKHKAMSLAYLGYGGEFIIYSVVWPLFLFLFFGTVINLGIIVSLASLISAAFALSVGEWVDKQGEKRAVLLGSPLVSLSWLARAIGRNMVPFVFADSLWNFGQRLLYIPLDSLSYKKAKEGESGKGILFRMITVTSGTIFSLLVLMIWVYLTGNLSSSFYFVALLGALPLIAVLRGKIRGAK